MKKVSKIKKFVLEPFPWQDLSEQFVIGVDEVGRGCLAGPVYAAAVILNPGKDLSSLTDSKVLSEARRESLFPQIYEDHKVGVGFATVEEISELNILSASLLAMERAVRKLGVLDESSIHILVDGNQKIPGLMDRQQTTVVKGDLRATPIAAASIIAKVTRDRLLVDLSKEFPQYGFERHKGYCTAVHKAAIKEHGPCSVHRPTFAGVREFL